MQRGSQTEIIPDSIVGLVEQWLGSKWTTPFGRFYRSLVNSTLHPQGNGTVSASTSLEESTVFPMPLPFREVLEERKQASMKPLEAR